MLCYIECRFCTRVFYFILLDFFLMLAAVECLAQRCNLGIYGVVFCGRYSLSLQVIFDLKFLVKIYLIYG